MSEPKRGRPSLREYLARMTPRERIILLVGAAAALAFVIFLALSLGHRGKTGKKNPLQELADQKIAFDKNLAAYAGLKPTLDLVDNKLAARPKDFDLFRKLNQLVESTGIRPLVVKMDPGSAETKAFLDEEYVDLNIQRIDLRQLVLFLQQVDKLPGMVRIGQLSVKIRLDQSKTLDAVMRISAFKEKEQ